MLRTPYFVYLFIITRHKRHGGYGHVCVSNCTSASQHTDWLDWIHKLNNLFWNLFFCLMHHFPKKIYHSFQLHTGKGTVLAWHLLPNSFTTLVHRWFFVYFLTEPLFRINLLFKHITIYISFTYNIYALLSTKAPKASIICATVHQNSSRPGTITQKFYIK